MSLGNVPLEPLQFFAQSSGQTALAFDSAAAWPVRERDLPHAVRMQRRRERQLARRPGFTPVDNKRVNAIALAALELRQSEGLEGERLRRQVLADVTPQLPVEGFKRRLRAPRPSKSDCAVYRAGNRRAAGEGWAD